MVSARKREKASKLMSSCVQTRSASPSYLTTSSTVCQSVKGTCWSSMRTILHGLPFGSLTTLSRQMWEYAFSMNADISRRARIMAGVGEWALRRLS